MAKVRKFKDDFILQGTKDMAVSISDMTYGYQNTVVPPEHYEKILEATNEELLDVEKTVDVALNIVPVFEMLSKIKKDNPRGFFMGLLMTEMKVKPSTMTHVQFDALSEAWKSYDNAKPKSKKLLNDNIINIYKDIEANGAELNSFDDSSELS